MMKKALPREDGFSLIANGREHRVTDIRELRKLLVGVRRRKYSELGLFWGGLPEHNFAVLINGKRAWAVYTLRLDQASFSSRNPLYRGSPEVEVEFVLANGQEDHRPADQTIATGKALKAIEYFFVHKKLAPWITWHDDFAKLASRKRSVRRQ